MSSPYPMGARVEFTDDTETMSLAAKGTPHIAHGFVNGHPITDDAGEITHVPCWCERHGREATTVYVARRNVLLVVPTRP